jgi:endonuclease/exonuclease/phosphatase family metal-dependent hydrolase
VRLVSYNVRYFGHGLKGLGSTAQSKQRIARALADLSPRPDLIALQEVETRSIRARIAYQGAHPGETQLEAFLRHFTLELRRVGCAQPYQPWYFPAHAYRIGPVKLYTTGLAILVNTQKIGVLSDNGAKPHHITHHRSEVLRQVKQSRIAAHLHLEDSRGRRFHLFNTHLSLPTFWTPEFWSQNAKLGHGLNQIAEAKSLSAYITATAKTEPFLVVGDFNSAPATPVYKLLVDEIGLRGAQAVLKQIDPADPDGFPTAGFLNLRMHLDHIFAGRQVEFIDMKDTHPFGDEAGPFHLLSDHVPLITEFEL